jgi:hypothetical protein
LARSPLPKAAFRPDSGSIVLVSGRFPGKKGSCRSYGGFNGQKSSSHLAKVPFWPKIDSAQPQFLNFDRKTRLRGRLSRVVDQETISCALKSGFFPGKRSQTTANSGWLKKIAVEDGEN